MNVRQALDVSNRSVSHREAEIFLQHATGKERAWLHAHDDYELDDTQALLFLSCLDRREQNEPVAYITGKKEFYGREFICDSRALIPRPETEGIVDLALKWLPDRFHTKTKATNKPCPQKILELGTGSGNIAVTLALELASRNIPSEIIATDISGEALALAKDNWTALSKGQEHPLVSLKFLEADLFDHEAIRERGPFDLITANLPYVPTSWRIDPAAQPEVVFQEPDIALFGGEDGLDHYRIFFAGVSNHLKEDGLILIEYGEDETGDITPLAETALPNKTLQVHKDYAQLDRILEIF